jgi:hypothetical protein
MGWVWDALSQRALRGVWRVRAPGPQNVNQAHSSDEFDRLLQEEAPVSQPGDRFTPGWLYWVV